MAVAYQHVREDPQPPSVYDHELTPEMDAIVLKALTKDPDYRYQSADEMRADIEAYLDGQPVAATAAMGAVGYGYGHGGYSDGAPTTAMPAQDGGQTTMMPPMRDDDGGYGGYDEERPGGGSRRRQQKKNHTSTILLVVAGVLVLVGAIFIGKSLFSGNSNGDQIQAPDLTGQTMAQARSSATNVGVKVVRGTDAFCDQDRGHVCSQTPKPDAEIAKGQSITVYVSKGSQPVAVPNEVNKNVDDAKQDLQSKGFTNIDTKPDDGTSGKPEGTVLSQDPAASTQIAKTAKITLTIAAAPSQFPVPNVVGQPFATASQQLTSIGFKVVESDTPSSSPVGTVISQSPGANQQAAKGATITLGVAAAQTGGTVPGDIVGKKLTDVQAELAGMGLNVAVVPGNPTDGNAYVTASDPPPGTPVTPGQTVTVQTQDGPGNGGGFIGGQG